MQGAVYNLLEEARYDFLHDKHQPKLFGFTLPFPRRDGTAGDQRWSMIGAHDEELISRLKSALDQMAVLDIGEMSFAIEGTKIISPKIDQFGVLRTSSPILIRLDGQRAADEFDLDIEYDRTHWYPELGTEVFFTRVYENLQRKFRLAFGEQPPEPPYFNAFRLDKHLAKPISFTDTERTFLLSEWSFGYEVAGNQHKKLLNLALDVGLGELNSLGFGFMNVKPDSHLKSNTHRI